MTASLTGAAFVVVSRAELGGVSVFSWRPAPHGVPARLTAWLAAGASVVFLLGALIASLAGAPPAHARGPGGGYYDAGHGNGKSGEGLMSVWSTMHAPLRW